MRLVQHNTRAEIKKLISNDGRFDSFSDSCTWPDHPRQRASEPNESFAIAEQAQTKYCIRQGASYDHPSGKVQIDAAYVVANAPIVREQLQKAAVRLAHLLDAALGKQ